MRPMQAAVRQLSDLTERTSGKDAFNPFGPSREARQQETMCDRPLPRAVD